MKLKPQIRIYQKFVNELGGKFIAEEFINIKIKELCSEHRILGQEVRLSLYIYFLCYVYSLAAYTV